jgi:RHS repeat-associated protein
VTDPAGISKTFTSDVSGNLTMVAEPNPAGGSFTTSYTYDWMNHLIGSSMTRGSTTQTRTFVYNNAGQLTSATNPESGTVSYSYSADTTLWGKTDANGQLTVYGYDASKRVTSVHVYPYGWSYGEDPCQLVTYGYDAGTNGFGRLTSTAYGLPNPGSGSPLSGSCTGMANGYAYQEGYTYDGPGQVTNKTFTLTTNYPGWGGSPAVASIGIGYTYDSVGRLSTVTYPTPTLYGTPPAYTYGYDGMSRPVSLTDGGGTPWVQSGQYDAAGHMTSMIVGNPGPYWGDLRTKTVGYNVNGQIASLNWVYTTDPSIQPWNIQYRYSSTQNNGQITQMVDISGETVSYAYDALKRLTGATSVTGSTTNWTQSFGYDGFGNMTSKSLNGGGNSAPAVDPTTNRLTSGYDANGNMLTGYGLTMTYDGRNRVASATPTYSGTEYYGYAPDNKRIYRWNPTTGTEEWTFYGAKGERIGSFGLNTSATYYSGTYYFYATETNVWFAGQLISNANGFVLRDRLGSDRETGAEYYPYGEEITSTANGMEKYGTYFRDSFTALDYADQRYYASSYGRFNTPDPMAASAKSNNPGSWNRYAYTLGDPVNNNDPRGMNLADPNDPSCVNDPDGCEDDGWGDAPIVSPVDLEDQIAPEYICNVNPLWNMEHPSVCGWVDAQVVSQIAANGGSTGGPVSLYSVLGNLWTAYETALSALNNPKCAGLFGTHGGVSPSTLLTDLYYGAGGYGSIKVGPIPPPKNPNQTINATTGIIPTSQTVIIMINSSAGDFVNGTTQQQAITLLHELGHAEWDIFGKNASKIKPDGSSTGTSLDNTWKVKTTCF